MLKAGGHEVVGISRPNNVDVITGEGLAAALDGVECVIDTATGPSPEQGEVTEFFTTPPGTCTRPGHGPGCAGWWWYRS